MIKKINKFLVASFVLGAIPLTAYGFINNVDQLSTALGNIVTFLQSLLFALAAIFLIIAAYKFLTAAGDEEKFKEGKKMITYTIVAIVVGLVATGVVSLVESIVGAGL